MALEIGLDKPPTGTDLRENLNRTRTWINAFCVDGSHSTQFGKMPTVKLNDYLVRQSVRTWYTSLDSSPYDIGLCAYAELLLHMMQYRKTIGLTDDLANRLSEV
jgi:transcriptional regulatory protein LEU3